MGENKTVAMGPETKDTVDDNISILGLACKE